MIESKVITVVIELKTGFEKNLKKTLKKVWWFKKEVVTLQSIKK